MGAFYFSGSVCPACAALHAGSRTESSQSSNFVRLAMGVIFLLLLLPLSVHSEDLGKLSANPAGLSGS